MNALQRNIPAESKLFLFIRDWFGTQPAEPAPATTPKPNNMLDQPEEETYPVWNGELDEPIWW